MRCNLFSVCHRGKAALSFHAHIWDATLSKMVSSKVIPSLISCSHMRCNSRNCANFIAPLFNFCCIRSHVCSEMALSPLMERDFWCEPLSISMYTYGSHPVRNANLGSAWVLHQRINTSYDSYSRPWGDRTPQLLVSAVFGCFLRSWEAIIPYNTSSYPILFNSLRLLH